MERRGGRVVEGCVEGDLLLVVFDLAREVLDLEREELLEEEELGS